MNDQGSITELLNQTARDLVSHFSEFELIHDWPVLTRLGSGVLWIDLATGQTHHNGRQVDLFISPAPFNRGSGRVSPELIYLRRLLRTPPSPRVLR
jgi:hypothetical protein